jgi:hypothetical protein
MTELTKVRQPRSRWDALLGREVWQYADGRIMLRGYSMRAVIRWYRKNYPGSFPRSTP